MEKASTGLHRAGAPTIIAAGSQGAEASFSSGMPSQAHIARPELQGRRYWSGISVLSKRSFRSFATSNFEADDERSSTDGNMSSHTSESDLRRLGALYYSGHDARPTSAKELLGWYMYGFAAEVYVVCGIGSSSPLVLYLLFLGCVQQSFVANKLPLLSSCRCDDHST